MELVKCAQMQISGRTDQGSDSRAIAFAPSPDCTNCRSTSPGSVSSAPTLQQRRPSQLVTRPRFASRALVLHSSSSYISPLRRSTADHPRFLLGPHSRSSLAAQSISNATPFLFKHPQDALLHPHRQFRCLQRRYAHLRCRRGRRVLAREARLGSLHRSHHQCDGQLPHRTGLAHDDRRFREQQPVRFYARALLNPAVQE